MSGESKAAPTRLYVKGVVMSYTRWVTGWHYHARLRSL